MSQDFYTYTVTGKYQFPLDMLRYDQCYPSGGDDAARIGYSLDSERSNREGYTIRMISLRRPTVARWASFGWACSEAEEL